MTRENHLVRPYFASIHLTLMTKRCGIKMAFKKTKKLLLSTFLGNYFSYNNFRR